ncbi:MAG: FAD-binding and (Fe-S)-binding domain-containing protein [Bacteroides sp.]|jgi:D-lactate dehydrogenase|nr:FAD-binding and (Fe-S)-binding domain-containing protein [Bacteroides sp.]
MEKQVKALAGRLRRELGSSKVFTKPVDLLSKGTDASFYRLIPQLAVRVESEQEAIAVIKACFEVGIPLTFKAGGTSLSGQTITDSVLMEIGDRYSGSHISEDGRFATFACGLVGGLANGRLAPYGRKLGPSPASIHSARIGGIVSNNASGSSYGIRYNSYNTIRGMRLVMADGTLLDTRLEESREAFRQSQASMLDGLRQLSERVKANAKMIEKIRHKYQLKNTCGYGVNALVDFEDPVDILEHLMIGAEGTLGFISEVSFETVPDLPLKAASLIFFPNIRNACQAIMPLRQLQVSAAELMDYNALQSVADKPGMPDVLKTLNPSAVALLIDTSASDLQSLQKQMNEIVEGLKDIPTLYPISFTDDSSVYASLWRVREGLFTSAASARLAGTACIIEDLAFRAPVLADALTELKLLLEDFDYPGYVIWGHLLDGNIHFVIMPDFSKAEEKERYERFMEALAVLTLKYDGSLKAEHGTGRNMAPFVAREWGEDIYGVMKTIKQIVDPAGILNPGVLINKDPGIHLSNIKSMPAAHKLIDQCIECGFCEPACPSKDLTLTPRQRIVVYRRLHELASTGDFSEEYRHLKKAFAYAGDATCATDGLCEINCPVDINTGTLIKELRFKHNGAFSRGAAWAIGSSIGFVTAFLRLFLNTAFYKQKLFGQGLLVSTTGFLHKILGTPVWNEQTPKGAPRIQKPKVRKGPKKVVYFPTCINRTFGVSAGTEEKEALVNKTISLLEKAGLEVILPGGYNHLCCGMAFSSKGFRKEAKRREEELEAALLKATENGKYPVLCEMSPCLLHMKETLSKDLQLFEPVAFSLNYLVPRLRFHPKDARITVHATCSTTKMGLDKDLVKLAKMCAREVVVPDQVGCCGWAGDRGFTHPELNQAALRHLKDQLPEDVRQGYSTSRTCEIGLSSQAGIPYHSIFYLIDEVTETLDL